MSLRNLSASTAKYFSSQVLSQGLGFIRLLLLPNLLGPYGYGTLSVFTAVAQYSQFANLGIHTNILYQVPLLRGRREFDRARQIPDIVLTVNLITGVLACVAVLLFVALKAPTLSNTLVLALTAVALLPFLQNMRGLYTLLLRVDMRFGLLTWVMNLETVLSLLLVLTAAALFGVSGAILASVAAPAIALLTAAVMSGYRFSLRLPISELIELLKFSLLVHFGFGLLITFLATVDRLMMARYLAAEHIGLYAIGLTVKSLVLILPTAIAAVAAPAVAEESGKVRGRVTDYLRPLTYLSALCGFGLAALAAVGAPVLITLAFPEYTAAIPSARILAFVAGAEAVGAIGHYVLIARGQIKTYLALVGLLASIAWLGFDFLLAQGFGIEAVAAAMLALGLARALAVVFLATRAAENSGAAFILVVRVTLIGVYTGVVTLGATWLFPLPAEGTPVARAVSMMPQFALMLAGLLLLVWYFDARTRLIRAMLAQGLSAVRTMGGGRSAALRL